MSKIKDFLCRLVRLEPMTNRDLILDELDAMDGEKFAIATGLVFNEKVVEQIQAEGLKDFETWLNRPATMKTILN